MATLDLITGGRILLVFLALLCAGLVSGRQNSQSYCRTESVVELQPASVTCHFPEDVSVHNHSVNIVRYDFSGESFVPELILSCFWEQHQNEYNCSTAKDFELDGRISDTVTVSTRAATSRHAGSYACNYAGESPSEFNICRLNVKNPKISCSATKVSMGETATLTCFFNTNVNQSQEGFYIKRIPSYSDVGPALDVLTCNWVKNHPDGIFCYTRKGCKLVTKNIDNEVTVEIEEVDLSHTGEYFCDTVPHTRGVTAEHCRLTAQVKTQETRTTTQQPDESIPEELASSAFGTGRNIHELLFYHFAAISIALCVWRETKR